MNEDKLSNHEIRIRLLGGTGTREGARKGWETRRAKAKARMVPSPKESRAKSLPFPLPISKETLLRRPKEPLVRPKETPPIRNYLTPEVNIYTENVRLVDKPIKSVRSQLPPSFERVIREQKQDEFKPIHEQIDDFLENSERERNEYEALERERRFWAEEDRKAEGREDFGLGLSGGCQTRGFQQAFGTAYGKCRYDRVMENVDNFNRLMNVRNQYGFTKG